MTDVLIEISMEIDASTLPGKKTYVKVLERAPWEEIFLMLCHVKSDMSCIDTEDRLWHRAGRVNAACVYVCMYAGGA